MPTEDIITHIFYHVDNAMQDMKKVAQAKLYPSEVMTIGILFTLQGGHFRAFYRWLKRDYDGLFPRATRSITLLRQLQKQQVHTDKLLAEPSVFNVVDSLPIELLFPIREGRSPQQIGKKGKDKDDGRLGLSWLGSLIPLGWSWDGNGQP
jgi:hypothetical protein